MTGKEMLDEIDRQIYYDQKEIEHMELVKCVCYVLVISVILCGLLSIAGNVKELWNALASCF